MKTKTYIFSIFSTLFFYLAILFFIIGFNFTDSPPGPFWYQQFMPSGLPNFQVSDMTFIDSLTGWVVTGNGSPNDSSGYILGTTNAGNNWILQLAEVRDFSRVKFLNNNTGFVSGGYNTGARLYKTINGGANWFLINGPGGQIYYDDMSILSEDTIWIAISQFATGGVYYTSNGGASWTRQLDLGSQNPSHIYMYNARIGFVTKDNSYVRKTTDGGGNWPLILNNESFTDMYFIDSLTGWKCFGVPDSIQHTTDGGYNWSKQVLPSEGFPLFFSRMLRFTFVNKDTAWGVGGTFNSGGGNKGFLYKTTNGGINWGYQLPDTNSVNIGKYYYSSFINKLYGWAYSTSPTGIHTVTGGDTSVLAMQQISTETPKDFKLFQNYPNPFNPATVIKYDVKRQTTNVRLIVYDITGREITTLVNQKQTAGTYEVTFSAEQVASGVYFYSLFTDGYLIDTKKLILLK